METLDSVIKKKKSNRLKYLFKCEYCNTDVICEDNEFDNFYGIPPHSKDEHAWLCPICGHVNIENKNGLKEKIYKENTIIDIWTVITDVMNGTVKMFTKTASFNSKELADKVADAVVNANRDKIINITIEHTKLYTDETDVPILNINKKQ